MTDHPPIIDYEGSDYQTSFWDFGGRDYEDRSEAIALRRLLPHGGDLMLEIGAGAGRNTLRYQGYKRIVLLDYSLTQMQQAQARLGRDKRFTYVAADVYRLPFVDRLFDGVTMIRVLHHIAKPSLALRQIKRVIRPKGSFILEFANKQHLKRILRYILTRQEDSPFTPETVEVSKLHFNFHPKTVRAWLAEEGFEIQRQLTVSHFRLGLFKRLIPTTLLVALDSIAQLTGNWWQLTPSVFVKSTAKGKISDQSQAPNGFFRCPVCERDLPDEIQGALRCPGCGKVWPIRDQIYDFRDS
jgi:ubiquinone/menaquinone biosynthesis C-methylase UbiE